MNNNITLKKRIAIALTMLVLMITYIGYKRFEPYYIQANSFYILNKTSLQTMAQLMVADSNIKEVSKINKEGIYFIDVSGNKSLLPREEIRSFDEINVQASIYPVRKLDKKISFFVGSKRKFNTTFNISFNYFPNSEDLEDNCDKSYSTKVHGICNHVLNSNWVLRYEWVSL